MSLADPILEAPPTEAQSPSTALDSRESLSESSKARRGPFRPELWRNARQRNAARLRVFYFRGFDIVGVAFVTVVSTGFGDLKTWLLSPLIDTLPPILGSILVLSLMRSLGLYRFSADNQALVQFAKVALVAACGCGLALVCALAFERPSTVIHVYGYWAISLISFLAISHLGWSLLVRHWRRSGALTPNVVVVGATRHAEQLILDALQRRDLNVLGIFDDRLARAPETLVGVPILGTAKALMNHRLTPYIDRVVLAIDPSAKARVRDLANHLSTLPTPLTLLVDADTKSKRNKALEQLANAPLPHLEGPVDPDRRAFNKRLQDVIIGSLALFLLSPLLLMISVLVRLDSKGPALFRQRRHGFNQEEIVVWKFRTMRHETADASASRQVTANDHRVTRLGRFLRATSLDELPQLINVVKGEMSLVGPRPHAIGMKTGDKESAKLVSDYAHRHRIKPGMTGWAAIQGSRGPLHTEDDVQQRVQLDISYIERQSFWLDIWIILVTIPVLLGDRMAVR